MPEDVELSPRAQRIVVVARELLEEEGEEGMSMRRIAARLGVRAPSLYKHLPDKKALEDAIVATVLDDLARLGRDAVDAAAAEGADELHALMDAYRDYAVANPALYRLNVRGPLDEGPLVRGAEVRSAGPLVRACHGDGLAAMTIFAFVHGLVDLELKQRIPPGYQLDAIRRRGIEALRPGPAG
jgi:AcrR family transcriptional regulator